MEAFGAVFLFFFLAACSAEGPKGGPSEGRFFKSSGKPVSVTAFAIAGREIPLVVSTSGKTEVSDRYVAKAPANVRIQKLFVEEGGRVQAGDPLVKFDDQLAGLRLAKARAEIREAEAGLANDNFLRTNRDQLLEDGKMSELEAEGIDERIELRQATIDRAKAEIELYERMAELGQLNSPIAGVVAKTNVTEGADVNEDQELIEVVRLDPIPFVFAVPAEAMAALGKGTEIAVRFGAFPGQEFTGEVVNVGAEVSAEGGGVPVKLNLPNDDLLLKAEMKGEVVIRTQVSKKIFPIQEAAIVHSEKSAYVYKIAGGKVKKVAVDLGDPYNGQPTVEKGLAEGDLIVATADEEGLKDGVPVEVEATRAAK